MSGLFSALSISGRSLMAQQAAAQVAGRNISNASSPGYHRQSAAIGILGFGSGDGVTVLQAVDRQLERRLGVEQGRSEFERARSEGLARMESAVAELGDGGLSAHLDRFFDSWRRLTVAPDDRVARQDVLQKASALAARIRRAAADLNDLRTQADAQVLAGVSEVNRLIEEVGELNLNVVRAEVGGGVSPELRDRRGVVLGQLAELIGATSIERADGSADVLLGDGLVLVSGASTRALVSGTDAGTGATTISISGGGGARVESLLTRGSIAGVLAYRDSELPAATTALDDFAFDLATAVNAQHQAAFGLDGNTGRALFSTTATATGAAASLVLDAAVDGQPGFVGAAQATTGVPGDGGAAAAMVTLADALVASGNTKTLSDALASFVLDAGQNSASATARFEAQEVRRSELEEAWEEHSGVSIEEQMVALSRYQRAFEAASRVIGILDDMLDNLLRM